jgi:hypothetical protein
LIKSRIGLRQKNAQLRVEKIKKKEILQRTQHCRQPAAKSPRTKSQAAAGVRQCTRSAKSKKRPRTSIKQNENLKLKIFNLRFKQKYLPLHLKLTFFNHN